MYSGSTEAGRKNPVAGMFAEVTRVELVLWSIENQPETVALSRICCVAEPNGFEQTTGPPEAPPT
jgi:hypothetical protein